MTRTVRHLLAWAALAAALALTGGAAWLWWNPPWAPAVVRRTPAGTMLVYVDLAPLRATGWMSRLPPASGINSDYEAFVRESGFEFERDLDAVACALSGPPLAPTRTTCVLQGRFGPNFLAYLQHHATSRLPADGRTAFAFPGWTHPDEPMWVVELGGSDVLVSNAPAGSADALTRWASSSWHRSPELWRKPVDGMPIAYLGLDAERLAADGQLDGATAPWRGARTVRAIVTGDPIRGLSLDGTAAMASAADAAATNGWAHEMVAGVQAVLGQPSGGLSLAQLLDNLEMQQNGADFEFRLHLAPAVLASMVAAASANAH